MMHFRSGLIVVFLCLLSSLVTIAFLKKEKHEKPDNPSQPLKSGHIETTGPAANVTKIEPVKTELLWGEDIIAARDADYYFQEVKELEDKFSGSALRTKRRSAISEAVEFLSLLELAELYEILRGNPEGSLLGGRLAQRFAKEDPAEGMKWLEAECQRDDFNYAPMIFALNQPFKSFPKELLAELDQRRGCPKRGA